MERRSFLRGLLLAPIVVPIALVASERLTKKSSNIQEMLDLKIRRFEDGLKAMMSPDLEWVSTKDKGILT